MPSLLPPSAHSRQASARDGTNASATRSLSGSLVNRENAGCIFAEPRSKPRRGGAVLIRSLRFPLHVPSAVRPNAGPEQTTDSRTAFFYEGSRR